MTSAKFGSRRLTRSNSERARGRVSGGSAGGEGALHDAREVRTAPAHAPERRGGRGQVAGALLGGGEGIPAPQVVLLRVLPLAPPPRQHRDRLTHPAAVGEA